MSLEQDIANLTTQTGALLALPGQLNATAMAQITALATLYNTRAAARYAEIWLDPVNGLDANPGTLAAPAKTMAGAVALAPTGTMTYIYCMSDVAISADVYVYNRSLRIKPLGTSQIVMSFDRYLTGDGATAKGNVRGFRMAGASSIVFENLNIAMPVDDGAWPGYTKLANWLVSMYTTAVIGPMAVAFSGCTITYGGAAFGPLVQGGYPMNYIETSVTIVGNTSLNGRRFSGVTDTTTGTAVSGLPWLRTNLTTV